MLPSDKKKGLWTQEPLTNLERDKRAEPASCSSLFAEIKGHADIYECLWLYLENKEELREEGDSREGHYLLCTRFTS